jgi:hypothetical protein
MQWQTMILSVPFIGRKRERRRYHGGETTDDEWSYSMLPFQREERKGQHLFWKGKGACEATLGYHVEERLEDAAPWPAFRVRRRLD